MSSLNGLNSAQTEAVETPAGPVLVLAGPGSGKTRVLTYRVAHLIRQYGVSPYNIIAVTFTNKAAREMKERLEKLVGHRAHDLTVGTFHSACVRILRRETTHLNLDPNFLIYDDDDQMGLIRQALKELDLDEKQYSPRALQSSISRAKSKLLSPGEYALDVRNYWDEIVARAYRKYQDLMKANRALDFDDLINETVRLFDEHPRVLEKYQDRYHHVLVDEYQDTNRAQSRLVAQLGAKRRNVFVVGDPDQSIYGWRQADIRNILEFESEYPEARIVVLEQNYRSTKNILETATHVIAANQQRKPKKLWTENEVGLPVTIFEAYNELEEAQFVVEEIERLLARDDYRTADVAVMYRTNVQSRALEEAFVRHGVRYKLVGGTRFYERREVKDVLAWLRLVHNPYDSVSLYRVVNNTPAGKGIGAKTLSLLETWARALDEPMQTAMRLLQEAAEGEGGSRSSQPATNAESLETAHRRGPIAARPPAINPRSKRALLSFLELLDSFTAAKERVSLVELLDLVVDRSGYARFVRDGTPEGEERWENVVELRSVAREYAEAAPGTELSTFLEELALLTDVDSLDGSHDAVTLITLHAAKGLEFPVVFIVGMEEGLLPHSRSLNSAHEVEEERRLCYVGITRSKDRLYLLHAFRRTIYGASNIGQRSRFLSSIPDHLIKGGLVEGPPPTPAPFIGERPANHSGQGQARGKPAAIAAKYAAGNKVRHPVFGVGVVVESKAVSEDEEVTVAFIDKGVKKLNTSFAKLERL